MRTRVTNQRALTVASLVLIGLSAWVAFIAVMGPMGCQVPAFQSLALGGPPVIERPLLCAVETVLPLGVWGVLGLVVGAGYLLVRGVSRRGL